jgi:hypothetical protein
MTAASPQSLRRRLEDAGVIDAVEAVGMRVVSGVCCECKTVQHLAVTETSSRPTCIVCDGALLDQAPAGDA